MDHNIKILVVTHVPYKLLEGKYFVSIHAGRAIASERSKDGKINRSDYEWLLENTIGDDSGDNISEKNRYYSECSALYWAWKNYDKLGNPDYIGLMHYRRHFVFNDKYFESVPKGNWEKGLQFIKSDFINDEYLGKIGLNDQNIENVCNNYDLIVSNDSDLEIIRNRNIREDYKTTILGTDVKDFDLMLEIINKKYPDYKDVILEKIFGYKKTLYQMFIMKKELFFEYCDFLFGVLFEVEKQVDFSAYSINGQRSLGYLAEIIMSIFVWKKEKEGINVKKLGISMVDYPFEKKQLEKILDKGCPSCADKFILQMKYLLSVGKNRENARFEYNRIKTKIKSYKKLQKLIDLGINAKD